MRTRTRTLRPASPYARFRRDHSRVLARLDSLVACIPGRGRAIDEPPLKRHLAAIGRQFDTHLAAEEALIYPTLAQAFPEAAPTLAPLHEEHDELRAMLASLIQRLGTPRGRDRDVQIGVEVRDLVDLLRVHIRKEESVVYDVSERVLEPRELRGLARRLDPFIAARHRRVVTRRRKGTS
jgi:hemerythrin-like domain-containing protein